MTIIQDFIVPFTLLILFLGWWVHNWTVLSRLTRIKGYKVGIKWFIDNRPYKLRISATSSLVSGFIAFIWFDPSSLDLLTQSGRQSLAIYASTLFGIGVGADFIVDQVGTKATTRQKEEPEPEDGKSLILDQTERDKILKDMKDD